jgi:hypothetical protein
MCCFTSGSQQVKKAIRWVNRPSREISPPLAPLPKYAPVTIIVKIHETNTFPDNLPVEILKIVIAEGDSSNTSRNTLSRRDRDSVFRSK